MNFQREKIADGKKFLVCEILIDEVSEFRKFFELLPKKQRNILTAKIVMIADHGPLKNIEKFRHEGDGIYAIKQNQIRVYCFIDQDKVIILTNGYIKKSQKADPNILKKAMKIREQYYLHYQPAN